MKQLTDETQKSLEAIRHKVSDKGKYTSSDYTAQDVLHLQEVNREVLKWSGINQSTINMSCTSCIQEAINIVYNYVTYHEIRPDNRKAKVIAVASKELLAAAKNISGKIQFVKGESTKPTIENIETGEVYNVPEDLHKMPYADLLSTANLYGYSGRRDKVSKLVAFIESKTKG